MNKKKVDVLLGLQWGDEGKGKIVDVLTPGYQMVARFQGGPNAGHTLEFEGQRYVLRSIPSGIFQGNKLNLIGNGVVLDPVLLREEAEQLAQSGHDIKKRLVISRKAHLILPTHRLLDAAQELSKGAAKIGTTGKGIGPCYTDKVARTGLRVGDIERDFETRYKAIRDRHVDLLQKMGADLSKLGEMEEAFYQSIEYLKDYQFVDSEILINEALEEGLNVLAEGAQGSLLDVDFGTYPFVTSSNTVSAGCCIGLGISPKAIGRVYGIFKAYCTRVGAGPFPTELQDEVGHLMADRGHEFGAVTGRPRRCGWIDLVALRYTIMLSGVTHLIMMKSDVLDTLSTIKACVAYRIGDKEYKNMPYSLEADIEPIYQELPGWQTPLDGCRSEQELPDAFRHYVAFLEAQLRVPISIISVGPDRSQTIMRKLNNEL
ncbi:adenylosuccinate synthase [uncultured Porphyromonas sp.]|uniref:adenylosuccinate synthase n=1 Tax=uncultured Porphyromonas sp. TaxID=159274 RepID=UPI002630F59E|nr:adenylosuccinate synthase [uncultured Porphyromonas sp.]